MKKIILAASLIATLGFVYAGVEGKGKGKGKKSCCEKSKSCTKDSAKTSEIKK